MLFSQILTNVWSWMEAVTPGALIQKAAMSAAAARGMPWCQMGGPAQVQKGKYAGFVQLIDFILTNLTPGTLTGSGWGKKYICELNKSLSCFYLIPIFCHQILTNVKIILISVMGGSVPTFLESIAVSAMMASWLQWTWKHALVGIIKMG